MPGRWSRRRLLHTAGVASVGVIAGCLGAEPDDEEGTPTCPSSNDTGPYDAVVEVRPPDRPSDPRVTVSYDDLSSAQQDRRTVRYQDLPPAQQRLVDRIMAETGGHGRYRVCVAELSESERITLERFAQRARDRFDEATMNFVYLDYKGEAYALAVRIEDLEYAP